MSNPQSIMEAELESIRDQVFSLPVRPAPAGATLEFSEDEVRILVLAPTGQDAALTTSFLTDAGFQSCACRTMYDLALKVEGGCAAIVVAEESLSTTSVEVLLKMLARQPSWSDIPIVLITSGGEMTQDSLRRLKVFGPGGNVTLLERPFRPMTLANTIEAALRARRRQYQVRDLLKERDTVLTSINDAFVTVDCQWRYTYVNEKAAELARMPREKMLGRNLWELFPQHIGSPVYNDLRRALAEQRIYHFEQFIENQNRWLDVRVYPSLRGLSILSADITERKEAEQLLEEQACQQQQLYQFVERLNRTESLNEVYDAALNTIQAALQSDRASILLFDQAGVMRFKAWRRLSDGYRQAIEGHSPWERGETDPLPLTIEDVQAAVLDEPLRRAIEEEGIRALAFIPLVYHGSLLGKFMIYYDEPHAFAPEELQLAQTIANQLAFGVERKRAQQELTRAKDRLASDLAGMTRLQNLSSRFVRQGDLQGLLEEIVDVAMVITGADKGNLQMCDSDSNALVLTAHRGFEQPFLDFFLRVDEDETFSACAAARASGERIVVEDVAQSPVFAGKPALDVLLAAGVRAVQSTPLFSRSGRLLGMLSTHFGVPHRPADRELRLLDVLARQAADFVERARADEALHEAQEEVRQHAEQLEKEVAARTAELSEMNSQLEAFVYSIAHDLRAPLRSMQAFSTILLDQYAPRLDHTAQDFARRIVRSAESMDALVLDLLAYGRVARAEMSLCTVDVQNTWNTALAQNEQIVQEKNALIETAVPLPRVIAHETMLGQVLANLLSNALKFTRPGVKPRIRFWGEPASDGLRLWIEDNGIGIAREHQDRIFRVFERLHGPAYAGTGIGLSIVRKGVERMGGQVGVESVPGKGSRFWVELPKG